MSSYGFGQERPSPHVDAPHRPPARYLVIIDAGGVTVAKMFLESRELVSEIDAGTEEVTQMTRGLSAQAGAPGPEWDRALAGHSAAERQAARVYTLDI
ncbi:MAG: hypothetical protein ABI696_16105 [Rubrivivax sp.]